MDERCCGHGNAKEMKTETWRKDKQTKNNKSTCTNSMADTGQRGSGEEEDIGKASETKLGRLGRAQMLKWVLNSFYWTVILWDGGRKLKQYGSDWLQCAVALRLEYFVLKRASIVFDSFFLIQNRKTHKCNWTNIGLFKSNARRPFFFFFSLFFFAPRKPVAFEFIRIVLRLVAAPIPVWVVVKVVKWNRCANTASVWLFNVHASSRKVIAIERKEDENFGNFGRFNQLAFSFAAYFDNCVHNACFSIYRVFKVL